MTSLRVALRHVAEASASELPGVPSADLILAPTTAEDLAAVLDSASEHRLKVLVWGGGTHQGYGDRVEPDLVISTGRLSRVIDWQPEDLTIVVEAGLSVVELEERLSTRRLTAILPERPGQATVGGVVAAGASGFRRTRYGPTRDRLLEVNLATGDGRLVRGGGRVVKNVTGYDLPRLAVGSFGRLGVIASVCLKLWPVPEACATLEVDDVQRAAALLYRPQAILARPGWARAYLAGTAAEVEDQTRLVGGPARPGHEWPEDPEGPVRWSLRVPPARLGEAVERLPDDWRWLALHGIGELRCGAGRFGVGAASELRGWCESVGGALVLADAPADVYREIDPWGSPPPHIELQRRLSLAFDPLGVINPGRLPGGI